jgi:integrase
MNTDRHRPEPGAHKTDPLPLIPVDKTHENRPASLMPPNRFQPQDPPAVGTTPAPRLLDRLRHAIRVQHYSIRTEDVYVDWVRRFILFFYHKRHPQELGAVAVTEFLTYLAVERQVASSTQNQAKSALLFLYRSVLEIDLPWLGEIVAAKERRRLPVVLTQAEVRRLLQERAQRQHGPVCRAALRHRHAAARRAAPARQGRGVRAQGVVGSRRQG